jgi:uncharacterized protein YndB with AHSA1/START domain
MSKRHSAASTRTSRIIKASPEELYEAFMDPAILVTWLPPGNMTGKIHAFDGRVGGGFRMSLFYPPDDNSFRGKTSEKEDMSDVRFVELVPPRKIVEAVTFVSDDPALKGEMTITVTFDEASGGTEVTFLCTDLPRGLRAEDNEEGARLSLEKLARRFE